MIAAMAHAASPAAATAPSTTTTSSSINQSSGEQPLDLSLTAINLSLPDHQHHHQRHDNSSDSIADKTRQHYNQVPIMHSRNNGAKLTDPLSHNLAAHSSLLQQRQYQSHQAINNSCPITDKMIDPSIVSQSLSRAASVCTNLNCTYLSQTQPTTAPLSASSIGNSMWPIAPAYSGTCTPASMSMSSLASSPSPSPSLSLSHSLHPHHHNTLGSTSSSRSNNNNNIGMYPSVHSRTQLAGQWSNNYHQTISSHSSINQLASSFGGFSTHPTTFQTHQFFTPRAHSSTPSNFSGLCLASMSNLNGVKHNLVTGHVLPPLPPPAFAFGSTSSLSSSKASSGSSHEHPTQVTNQPTPISVCSEPPIVATNNNNHSSCHPTVGDEKADLVRINIVNENSRYYQCSSCGIRFACLTNLKAHQTYYCSRQGPVIPPPQSLYAASADVGSRHAYSSTQLSSMAARVHALPARANCCADVVQY